MLLTDFKNYKRIVSWRPTSFYLSEVVKASFKAMNNIRITQNEHYWQCYLQTFKNYKLIVSWIHTSFYLLFVTFSQELIFTNFAYFRQIHKNLFCYMSKISYCTKIITYKILLSAEIFQYCQIIVYNLINWSILSFYQQQKLIPRYINQKNMFPRKLTILRLMNCKSYLNFQFFCVWL